MAYNIRLHPKADEDFIEAYTWYEEKQEGLGEKFIVAVKNKLKDVTDNPEAFGSRDKLLYREVLIDRFPYIIVYKIYQQKGEIFISSIHHAKKHPKNKYRR